MREGEKVLYSNNSLSYRFFQSKGETHKNGERMTSVKGKSKEPLRMTASSPEKEEQEKRAWD